MKEIIIMKKMLIRLAILVVIAGLGAQRAQSEVIVDVDFEFLTTSDTIGDGTRIQDVSGNGYHGFWGGTSSTFNIVETPGGVGVDTSDKADGYVILRDGLTGIPESWDGGTTTTSPYFTLEATKNYTFEAVVKLASTTPASSGIDGIMGNATNVVGGDTQFWMRMRNGDLEYDFRNATYNSSEFSGNIDLSAAYDGEFHNIAIVFDRSGGQVRSYLDGSLIHTKADANISSMGAILEGTRDFRLGAYNNTGGNYFTGVQDRYRISDTALSPGEFIAIPEPAAMSIILVVGVFTLIFRRRIA